MTDSRLQQLKRVWEASGSTEDETAYLRERVRVTDYYAPRMNWSAVKNGWRSERGLKKLSSSLYMLAGVVLQRFFPNDFAISFDYEEVTEAGVIPLPVLREFERHGETLDDAWFGEPLRARTPTLGGSPAVWVEFRISEDATSQYSVSVMFDEDAGDAEHAATTFTSEFESGGEKRWVVTSDLKDPIEDKLPQIERQLGSGSARSLWLQHRERLQGAESPLPQRLEAVFERSKVLDQLSLDQMVEERILQRLDPERVLEILAREREEQREGGEVPAETGKDGVRTFLISENSTDRRWVLSLTDEHLGLVPEDGDPSELVRLPRTHVDQELQLVDGLLLRGAKFLRGDFPRGFFFVEGPAFHAVKAWAGPPGPAAVRRAQGTPLRCLWEVPWGASLFLGGLVLPNETWASLDPAWLARGIQIFAGASLLTLTLLSTLVAHRALILLHATWLFVFGLSVGLRTLPWGVLDQVSLPGGWVLASAVWVWAAFRYRTYWKLLQDS